MCAVRTGKVYVCDKELYCVVSTVIVWIGTFYVVVCLLFVCLLLFFRGGQGSVKAIETE